MSNARKKKIMDALEGLSDDDSGDTSSTSTSSGDGDDEGGGKGDGGSGASAKRHKAADDGGNGDEGKKPRQLTLGDLEAQGFTAGPSVLGIRPPDDEPPAWNLSDGRAHKATEPDEESREERLRTREAATTGAELGADMAMRVAARAALMREEAKAEKERLRAEKKLTFNQKEKRKRDAGMAERGKNFVEEEKRIQRNFGMYSGFD